MKNDNILNQTTSNEGDQVITNVRQGFKDFFTRGISLPKLQDGVYSCTLRSATFIEADKTKNKDAQDYVRLELQLSDRLIIDNRFEKGFGIFESQIKEQLNLSDKAIAIPDLMQTLTESTFKIWVTHIEIEDRTFRNINYIAPKATANANANATVSSTAEF